jgi:hypothetical protein
MIRESKLTESAGLKACFDTNFLIYSVKQKVDFLTQLKNRGFSKFYVPDKVAHEVEELSKKLRGKDRTALRVVSEIIKREFEVIKTESDVADDSLIEVCLNHNCHLFTNDRILIKRAKKRGIPIGYLRGWKVVDVDAP